jgi:hypothetical protein
MLNEFQPQLFYVVHVLYVDETFKKGANFECLLLLETLEQY